MAKNWANGLPGEDRSPESGYPMATEGMPFPWRWYGGTISTDLDIIWEMSARLSPGSLSHVSGTQSRNRQ